MVALCNTAPRLCTRCQHNSRLPGQRWCRQCLTASQRDRRAAQRAAQADDATTAVTHAALQAMPHVPQGDGQAPTPALPPHSHEVAQALQAYRNAELAYRLATRCVWPLLPPAPTVKVHHLWQRVKLSKQRWLALVQVQRNAAGATTPV